jgi:hypothetical protein
MKSNWVKFFYSLLFVLSFFATGVLLMGMKKKETDSESADGVEVVNGNRDSHSHSHSDTNDTPVRKELDIPYVPIEARKPRNMAAGPSALYWIPGGGDGWWGFGGTWDYKLTKKFGVGSIFGYASRSRSGRKVNSASSALAIAGRAALYPMDDTGFHFGALFGIVRLSTSASVPGLSISQAGTFFGFGPALGYNFKLDRFTFGPEIEYLIVNEIGNVSILGNLKYWY